jgi:uncharacterized glyoxalase superfamily protein PhnB
MTFTLLLRCNDLNETREFYRSVLGFDVADTAEDTVTVEMAGGKLIFTSQDLWQSAPTCSGTIYFVVPDVDSFYVSVKDEATVSWPLQDMSYGSREFGVIDCNGYSLAFMQKI